MSQATLHIVCGLPGSGKTTRSRAIAAEIGVIRLCPDEWMSDLGIDLRNEGVREALERRFWELTRHLLESGTSVILESGAWSRNERDEWRGYARSVGAAVVLHWLDVPFDELLRRVRHRARHEGGLDIDESELRQWWNAFEPPTPAELALFDRFDSRHSPQIHSPS
jgi:predicted kinase